MGSIKESPSYVSNLSGSKPLRGHGLPVDRINGYIAEFQYHCIWWNTELQKHVQICMKHEKPLPEYIYKQGEILKLNSVKTDKNIKKFSDMHHL